MSVKFFAILTSLLLSLSLIAQQPYFRPLETSKKIEDIQISKIQQDKSGYIWLGTNKGLLRFNGLLSTYPDGNDSLKKNISALRIIDNLVVCGTTDGDIIITNQISNSIISALHICDDEITSIAKDGRGKLWIGTANSGIFIQTEKEKYAPISSLPDNVIHSLISNGGKIVAATDVGILVFNDPKSTATFRFLDIENGLSDNLVQTLEILNEKSIIAGCQNGSVCQINLEDYKITPYNSLNAENKSGITKIIHTIDEVVCFNENREIFIVKNATSTFLQSFSSDLTPFTLQNPFGDAIIDMEGNIIVCNYTNSLYVADSRFLFINEHENVDLKDIRSIFCDKNDNLWFQAKSGLYRHENTFSNQETLEKIIPESSNPKDEIISITEDSQGNMWFGTYGSGIIRYSPSQKTTKWFTEKDGLINNNVLSVAADKNGIWCATLGGACYIHNSQDEIRFEKEESVSNISKYIYAVFVDREENIWFGTDGSGAIMLGKNGTERINERFPLLSNNIFDITQDSKGNIWFLTSTQEILCLKGNNLEKREIVNEGVKPEIFAMEDDNHGNILILSSDGFALVNADNPQVEFLPFRNKIASNYLNISCTDNSGNIWMALEPTLIRYSPSSIQAIKSPVPRIESVLILLQPIDTTTHNFRYSDDHFTFRFSATWYQYPTKVKFRYQLEGYDNIWYETRDQEIAFPKLGSGTYTFRLQASTGNGWINAKEVSYTFTIEKPFYYTWWFILLIIFILISTVAFAIHNRDKKIQEKISLEKERIQSQFDTLRNQINPHFLFNSFNTLISTIAKDKDLAIHYVEQLSDYFRTILEQRDKETIQLKEEVALVEQYLFLQKQRFGENLKVDIEIQNQFLETSIPPLTLQLLAENAIKHNIISKSKPLTIQIKSEHGFISVCNNLQEKTTKEPSTGVGLNNIFNRYHILFSETVKIEKNESQYCVKVPIIEP
ncbi:MAG: two-component regulator propeller domain-containing protein [Flavobacteriales bacterium]